MLLYILCKQSTRRPTISYDITTTRFLSAKNAHTSTEKSNGIHLLSQSQASLSILARGKLYRVTSWNPGKRIKQVSTRVWWVAYICSTTLCFSENIYYVLIAGVEDKICRHREELGFSTGYVTWTPNYALDLTELKNGFT